MLRIRGPRPRGQTGLHHDFASELLRHRRLPPGGSYDNANNTSSIHSLSNSNLQARSNTRTPSNCIAEGRASRKRGWKVQGQLAGEWRDKLGRHRRARPTENANTNAIPDSGTAFAADVSMISSFPGTSCAGTEVSFEGLVEELRERLPRASPLTEFVTAQQQNTRHMCPGVEAMVPRAITTITDEKKHCGGNSTTHTGRMQQGEAAAAGMPPGCLRLRHPMMETMRTPTSSHHMVGSVPGCDSSKNNPRLKSSLGVGPQPSLVLPSGDTVFPDGSAYRLVTAEATHPDDSSPSAAMVAAAKAHERALPLLQVCAVKVAEPPGV